MKKYSYPQKLLHLPSGEPIKRLPRESGSQYWERCRKLKAIEFKNCPRCGSKEYRKNGKDFRDGKQVQRYKCKKCGTNWRD
jgi:DNA-directed RNA polymerase subunit M/transcription elongation factor TFIIS